MFAVPPVAVHGMVNPYGVSETVALSLPVAPFSLSVMRRSTLARSSPV